MVTLASPPLVVQPPETAVGQRLDRVLNSALPQISRSRLKVLIEAGAVATLDGVTLTDPSFRVKAGMSLAVRLPDPTPAKIMAEAIDLDIVYEDDALIVINKPAGMTVHPAPGASSGTLVNALLAHCQESLSGIGGVMRPGIVHRIDKDTSGLMVVAKTDAAHHGLAAQFATHTLERMYMALVWGVPVPRRGIVEGAIGRDPRNRKRMAMVKRGGKEAVTHYEVTRVLATGGASLIELRLETGRTHQIRVHMTASGHPLIGDSLYGKPTRPRLAALESALGETGRKVALSFPRQALHAAKLGFDHPLTGEALSFTAPLPKDMAELLDFLAGTRNLD
ncbi:MAG: RluA family pseudouridine synthase [Alphaproteobacteria bacterium]